NDASGDWLDGEAPVSTGAMTMDQVMPRRFADAVEVAVNPPPVPAANGPLSATAAAIKPPPDPIVWSRSVTPAGNSQPLDPPLLSAQYDTNTDPSRATGTDGVVRTVPDTVSIFTTAADTSSASE